MTVVTRDVDFGSCGLKGEYGGARPNYCHTAFMDKDNCVLVECSGWWQNKDGVTIIILHLRRYIVFWKRLGVHL